MSEARPPRLPGDRPPSDEIARMLRVDHAGEYGATRIYQGQLDVLGRRGTSEIRRMAETEKRHLARFDELLGERQVRPTLLHPFRGLLLELFFTSRKFLGRVELLGPEILRPFQRSVC